tara:strand:- start:34 stop:543 length:510 start_codon:yes stop_codon:yes gene_type:complete
VKISSQKHYLSSIKKISKYRINIFIIFLSVILAIVISLFGANSSLFKETNNQDWSLPNPPEIKLVSELNSILASPLFGGKPEIVEIIEEVNENENKNGKWKIIGIIEEGEEKFALINDLSNNKIRSVSVGDTFPNGEVLLEILKNSISVKNIKEVRTISLFNKEITEGK